MHEQYVALKYAAALLRWLFKVIQHIRMRMGYRERNLMTLDESFSRMAPSFHVGDLRLDLERAVGRLEPRQVEVLSLRDLYGYSADEVAKRLSISSEAVKSRLHRARTTVRRALEGEER